jgi:transposase
MLHTSGVKALEVGKAERERLRALARSTDADWVVRDRVDMVLLAAEGWSAPRIGRHLGWSAASVRRVVAAWRARGQDALFRQLPGPVPDVGRTRRIHAALEQLLHDAHRSWTAAQLAVALEKHAGVKLSARQVRRYLADMGATWRRTKMSLAHKQSPSHVAAAHRRLAGLKKKPAPGGWTSTT